MTRSPMRELVPAMMVIVLLVGACSGSDAEPAADPTASTSIPTADVEETVACDLMTPAERTRLAGVAVDTVVSADARAASSQCRWQESAALVQVTTLHAKEWARTLPDIVTQLESSTDVSSDADREDLARAKELLTGADSFSDAEACDAFTTLAEIGGADRGATTTISPVPITDTEVGLSAQICTGGALTSIIYSVPGLTETPKVDRTVTAVLKAVQERVLAAG